MAITVKVSVKDFNVSKFSEELLVLPVRATWAGFQSLDALRVTPFPEESRTVGYASGLPDDIAVRGELRFESDSPLTPAQDASLDSLLAAHDSATLTAEQVRQQQDASEMDQLFAVDRITYRDNIQNWDSIPNLAQLRAATKVMFIIIGKVLRYVIRSQRGGDF